MARPKGSKTKNYTIIEYPRKCELCNYMSNNPSMYHYHKKTHEPIPEGKLCDHGCGQLAKFRNTHNKFTCLELAQHCPKYLERHSKRVKTQWQQEGNELRRKENRDNLVNNILSDESKNKAKQVKREKFGYLYTSVNKEYRKYARLCRISAQRWAKENGYKIGKQTFHVDHIFSIFDGFKERLPPSIISHPANLQILPAKENSSKGFVSKITKEELLQRIEKWKKKPFKKQ